MGGEELPSERTFGGKKYVILLNTRGAVMRVYRILERQDRLKELQRWPKDFKPRRRL
jgi:hypothetical protein